MKKIFSKIKGDFGSWFLCVLLNFCFSVGILNISLLYLISNINSKIESAAFIVLCILWLPLAIVIGSIQFLES